MFWVDPRFLSQPGPRFLLLCLAHHASFNETFQFLFWTMFGMEEHTVVDMPQFLVPEFVGRAMYGIFTIVMVIVLLNMLIAMITNSFQKIEVRDLSQAPWGGTGRKTLAVLLCSHFYFMALYKFSSVQQGFQHCCCYGQTPSLMLCALFLGGSGGGGCGGGGGSLEHCIKVKWEHKKEADGFTLRPGE